jgi:small-conductance mechanosensitive channel/tetratricopeptide (TPR) repeat protein
MHVTGWPSRSILAAWGTLFLALVFGASAAADEAAAPKPSEAEMPSVETEAPQIGTRAQALAGRLEEVRAQRPAKALERLKPQIDELQTSVNVATERMEILLTGPANPLEIDAQVSSSRIMKRRFRALEGEIQRTADLLDRTLSEIDEESERWKRDRSNAEQQGAPQAVLQTIDQALADLRSAKQEVGDDLAATLQLLGRAYEEERRLRPALEKLEAAKKGLTEGLWVRQSEPLWRALPAREVLVALPAELGSRLTGIWEPVGPQLRQRRDAIILQGLFFLVLAWLISRTEKARERAHPGRREETPNALRYPWAAAFLIGILISRLLQVSDIRAFRIIFVPAALGCLYVVLSRVLVPALRGPLLALTLLAFLENLRFALPELPIANRFLLGLDLALALAGVLWLRRPERLQLIPGRAASSAAMRLVAGWVRLLAPVLGIGLVANVLGYRVLADSLALFAIWGSVLGAAWAAFVRIGEEVVEHLVEAGSLGPLRMARTSQAAFLRISRRGLRGIGFIAWAYITLGSSGILSPIRSALGGVLSASIGYGNVAISLGGVFAFFATLWLSWLLARFTSFALEEEVFSRVHTAPGVSFALSTFARYAILVLGFVVAMAAVGFSLDRVALILSALGVGIGFGLQNVVGNFVSGVILLSERPIRVGDWIQLTDLFGTVTKIGIRSSTVRTFDGADVIVPNGDLVSSRVTNWTLSDRKRRLILPVGVAYGTAPRRVLEILQEVARSHPDVLEDPAPSALFRGFGESALNFELRAFTEADWLGVTSELAVAITEALESADITIPFPQRDLHLRNVPELRDALKEVVGPPRPFGPDSPNANRDGFEDTPSSNE